MPDQAYCESCLLGVSQPADLLCKRKAAHAAPSTAGRTPTPCPCGHAAEKHDEDGCWRCACPESPVSPPARTASPGSDHA